LRAGLLHNLSSGFKLLLLQHLSPDDFVRGFDQLATLLILNLLVWAVLNTLRADTGARFMIDGAYGWAVYLLLGLFGCGLVARAQDRAADTRSLLIPVLAVAPYTLIGFSMWSDTSQVAAWPSIAWLLGMAYLLVLSVRILRAAYGHIRFRASLVAMALIIGAPWVPTTLNLETRLWATDDAGDSDSDDSAEVEPLLYDQPARIQAAVERVAPSQAGTPAVFYLGFAGVGDQSVFGREALFAQSVFAEHFGSGDRSMDLINDVDDRDSYPLATVSGLADALKLLAARMNPDQDVLVLMLTSHGSKEGLEVTNGALSLLQLGPTELRQALDESGIKWRVLIVSACYSGVFLEPLKTDATLIATASDAAHSSFGCADDRDLTYFGEAFLKDSVPTTASLEEAFKKAADLIQHREGAEHLEHSNPQLYVGSGIRQKLALLENGHNHKQQDAVVVRR
jgi:Peptidase C13 family